MFRSRIVRMGSGVIMAVLIGGLFLDVHEVHAVVRTWDGGGGADTNWGTCTNWTGDTCPTSSDIATFDATSTNNVTIAAALSGSTAPAGIDINAGYTGTITQSAGQGIAIGSSGFDQAAGTVIFTDAPVTINGHFTLSAGTFTAPSAANLSVKGNWTHTVGGTFNHNNGTVRFFSDTPDTTIDVNATESFYNFIVDKTNGWQVILAAGDTATINGTLTLTDGRLMSGSAASVYDLKGAISVGANWDSGTGNLKFSGSGDQSLALINTSSWDPIGGLTIDKATGTFTLGSALTLDCAGTSCNVTLTQGAFNLNGFALRTNDFTHTNGTFTSGAVTVDIDDDLTVSAGTWNASTGTTTVGGDLTVSVGATFNDNSGSFTFDTSVDQTVNVNVSETFYDLTINKGGWQQTITAGDKLIVTNVLNLTSGRFTTGTIDMQGPTTTVGASYSTGNTVLQFSGSATQTLTMQHASVNNFDGNIVIDKSGGSLTLASALTLDAGGQTFTLSNGVFSTGNFNLTTLAYSQTNGTFNGGSSTTVDINGAFTLSGGTYNATTGTTQVGDVYTHTAGGIFNHSNGTMKFDTAADKTYDVATSETFYNLTLDKGVYLATINTGDTFIVLNAFTCTGGRFGTGSLDLRGDVTISSGCGSTTSPISLTGSNTQTFTVSATTIDADFTINKSGGQVNQSGTFTLDCANCDFTIQEGTYDLNGGNISVTGAGTEKFVVESGGNLQLQGGETVTSDSSSYPQLDTGSTVTYDGASGPYTMKTYSNYKSVVINGGAAAVFNAPSAGLTIAQNLTITSGILSLNGAAFTLTGTLSNASTLRLRGSEAVSFTNDSDSGTIEFVGDADGAADQFGIKDLAYYGLKVNFTDAADSLTPTSDSLVSNLVGYWKLDEGSGTSAADSSGNSYTGTLTNMEAGDWSASVPTVNFTDPYVLNVDGVNEYVDLSNPAGLPLSNSPRTMCAWGNPGSTAAGYRWMAAYGTGTAWQNMGLGMNGTTLVGGIWGSDLTSASFWSVGTWKHVCLTFDGTTARLYANGTDVANGNKASWNIVRNVAYLGRQVNGSEYWNGSFDDVRIYSRELTAAEVTRLAGGYDTNTSTVSSITVNGPLTLTSGTFTAPATLNLGGSVTQDGGTFSHNSGTVNFTQNSATYDSASTQTFNVVNVNKATGQTLTIASGDSLLVTGALTFTDGLVDTGTLEAQAGVTVATTFDGGSGTLKFSGGNAQSFDLTGATDKWDGPIVLAKSANPVTLSSALVLDHANADVTITTGTLDANGNAITTSAGSDIAVNGTILALGSSTGHVFAGAVTVAGGTLNSNTSTTTFSGAFSLSSGAYNGNTSTPTFSGGVTISGGVFTATSGTMTVSGGWTHTGGGTFTHNNGAVLFAGNSATFDVATSETFASMTMNKSTGQTLTIGSGDALIVSGTIALTDGAVGTGTLDARGNVTVASTFDGGNATLSFGGAAAQSFDLTGATNKFDGDIVVAKSAESVSLASDAVLDASGQDVTVTSGTFSANTRNLTVAGNVAVNGGTMNLSTGTVDLNGNVAVGGGTLNMGSATITLAGDASYTSGTMTPGTSTVTLDGTNQAITGVTSWWNLTKTVATAATLTFPASTTTTVSGTLTLAGAASQLLSLRSSSVGVPATIAPVNVIAPSYIDIRDITITKSTMCIASTQGCVNSGGNSGWTFLVSGDDEPPIQKTVRILSPNGGEDYTVGDTIDIQWTTTGRIGYVNVLVSPDGGSTWETLADQVLNNEIFSWVIDIEPTGDALARVEAFDGLEVYASDVSNASFSVAAVEEVVEEAPIEEEVPEEVVPEEVVPEEEIPVEEIPEEVVVEVPVYGPFPVEVPIHGLVKLPDDGNFATAYDTSVYYVGDDKKRHAFPNEAVFASWFCDFSEVQVIPYNVFAALEPGEDISHRSGVRLVKFQTSPRAYAVDASGMFRWVASEQLAQMLYGDMWAKLITNISDALFGKYPLGEIIDSEDDFSPDDEGTSTLLPGLRTDIPGYVPETDRLSQCEA